VKLWLRHLLIPLLAALGASLLCVFGGWPAAAWVALHVVFAVTLSVLSGLPRWWWWIHAAIAPSLMLAFWWSPPVWVWPTCFFLAWLVFGGIHRSRVPLYLSGQGALAALDTVVPAGARVIDVGAGTGTVLRYLARRTDLRLFGVEHAWLPWLIGRVRLARVKPRPTLWLRDLHQVDLSVYDVVYAFLSPAAMPALWQKACAEMLPGSVLVSHAFSIPGAQPDRVVAVEGHPDRPLYCWRMGATA
jgi:hypothetical protein